MFINKDILKMIMYYLQDSMLTQTFFVLLSQALVLFLARLNLRISAWVRWDMSWSGMKMIKDIKWPNFGGKLLEKRVILCNLVMMVGESLSRPYSWFGCCFHIHIKGVNLFNTSFCHFINLFCYSGLWLILRMALMSWFERVSN